MGVRGKGSGLSTQQAAIDRRSPILDRRSSSLRPQFSSFLTQFSALVTQSCFCLRIADITIAVASSDPGLTLRAAGATEKFVVDEADPDVQIRVDWADLSNETIEPVRKNLGHAPDNSSPSPSPQTCPEPFDSAQDKLRRRRGEGILPRPERERAGVRVYDSTCGEKIFDSGALWQLYRHDSAYHFRFTSPTCGPVPYRVASFNLSFTSGEVYLHRPYFNPRRPVYPLEYPLDELLIINLLATGIGVELHACGLIDRSGNGHLFVGQSGAGKTTTARLWQHGEKAKILSDDRIILRKDRNGLWMYGTPWHGEAGFSCSARAPLKQIYLLRHGQKNELVPMRGAEATSRLFACSFPPFYNRAALDFTLAFFEEVVRAVPCHELRFVPDENVVEFIGEHSAISY